MKVFIMRGVPGCGKSQWCKDYLNQIDYCKPVVYCSADKYMVDADNKYEFKVERLPEVHDKCFTEYVVAVIGIREGAIETVFVDNTNIRVFEIAPYYRVAEAFGHEVEIIQFLIDPAVAAARNQHGVPADKVLQMAMAMEPLPPHWKVRYVYGDRCD